MGARTELISKLDFSSILDREGNKKRYNVTAVTLCSVPSS
jgi:hypothetical protein